MIAKRNPIHVKVAAALIRRVRSDRCASADKSGVALSIWIDRACKTIDAENSTARWAALAISQPGDIQRRHARRSRAPLPFGRKQAFTCVTLSHLTIPCWSHLKVFARDMGSIGRE